jgi:hypothetical protein
MRRETSRVSFLMCPFCVRGWLTEATTGPGLQGALLRVGLFGDELDFDGYARATTR